MCHVFVRVSVFYVHKSTHKLSGSNNAQTKHLHSHKAFNVFLPPVHTTQAWIVDVETPFGSLDSMLVGRECCENYAQTSANVHVMQAWIVDVETPFGSLDSKILVCDGSGEDPSCHNSACFLGWCTR